MPSIRTFLKGVLLTWAACLLMTDACHANLGLRFNSDAVHDLEVASEGGIYAISTTGNDPWIQTFPVALQRARDASALDFEYFCPKGLDHLQVYFGPVFSESNSQRIGSVGSSEGWIHFAADLSETIGDWGRAGDTLRIDFGGRRGVKMQIRNMQLRPTTEREKEIVATQQAKREREAAFERNLKTYLEATFDSHVSQVRVESDQILVQGVTTETDQVFLCDVAPC